MNYFKEEVKKIENKTLSELDRVFFTFIDINNTEDRMLAHDYIIRAIRIVCGEINQNNSKYIQEVYDRYYGEPRVPHSDMSMLMGSKQDKVKNRVEDTVNQKQSKVKI